MKLIDFKNFINELKKFAKNFITKNNAKESKIEII